MKTENIGAQKGAVEFSLLEALIFKGSGRGLPEKHYSRKRD